MKHPFLILAACAALAGCDDVGTKISSAAESTRTATEHLAAKSAAASYEREAKIYEDAEPMREAEAVALGERFYLRADPQGWTVIDRSTNGVASSASGESLDDLSLEDAQDLVDDLREADRKPAP